MYGENTKAGLVDYYCNLNESARKESPTLAENIDLRIARLKNEVTRLERVKVLLSEPTGLLNVPIDDLRFAMNY